MDHGAMTSSATMAMDGMASTTVTAAMAGATSAKPMSMGMGNGCKISMLWNWNTIDACFISSQWRITSTGMFAGSCIGVILLVMSLELIRRASKEYDRYLIRSAAASNSSIPPTILTPNDNTKTASGQVTPESGSVGRGGVRPTTLQQAIRATLHMVQFTIAYFIMLLAMYYNGYLIICIIIGAWLGAFVFSWGNLDFGGPKEDSTYCCG